MVRGRGARPHVAEILVPADGQDTSEAIVERVRSGEEWTGEFTVVRKDGEPIRIWVADRPVLRRARQPSSASSACPRTWQSTSGSTRVAEELSDRLQLALEAGGLGTFHWDMVSGAVSWDDRVHDAVRPSAGDLRRHLRRVPRAAAPRRPGGLGARRCGTRSSAGRRTRSTTGSCGRTARSTGSTAPAT